MRRPPVRGEDVAGEIGANDNFQWEERNYTLSLTRLELPTPATGCPENIYCGVFLANNRTVSSAPPLWDYFHLLQITIFAWPMHATGIRSPWEVLHKEELRSQHKKTRRQIPSQTNKHFVRALLFQRRMLRRKVKQIQQNWTNLAWLYGKPTFTFIRLL